MSCPGGSRARWSLQGGVEVGQAAFEWRLLLTSCVHESRATNVSHEPLHGGVEVGWAAIEWRARTHPCSRAIQAMSTTGVECDGHFMGALKWAGGCSSSVWCSQSAQARLEAQMSVWRHFSGALKWEQQVAGFISQLDTHAVVQLTPVATFFHELHEGRIKRAWDDRREAHGARWRVD